jgi:uncharacterized protein (TIGR00159 family)
VQELPGLRIVDLIDILLVAALLYYLYRLVRGTAAINIFIGIVTIFIIYGVTDYLKMEMLSRVLGAFVGAGMFALIVVFQQEIRKFLLALGSANIGSRRRILRQLRLLRNRSQNSREEIDEIVDACQNMSKSLTGALIVFKRNSSLDFVISTGDAQDIKVNKPIIESIFFKNSTLHDGAIVVEDDRIKATRTILPVTNSRDIPNRYGLRHRAAIGITERTDALALVVSEESGTISFVNNGEFERYSNTSDLKSRIKEYLE